LLHYRCLYGSVIKDVADLADIVDRPGVALLPTCSTCIVIVQKTSRRRLGWRSASPSSVSMSATETPTKPICFGPSRSTSYLNYRVTVQYRWAGCGRHFGVRPSSSAAMSHLLGQRWPIN